MVEANQHKFASDLLPEVVRGAIGAGMAVLSITTLNYVIAVLTVVYLALMVYGQLKQHGVIDKVRGWFGKKPAE